MSDVQLRDQTGESRFEAVQDGEVVGYAEYERADGSVTFTHTVVDAEVEGQGIGTRLVAFALDAARTAGLGVVPRCSFVRHFVDENPAYADLVRVGGSGGR